MESLLDPKLEELILRKMLQIISSQLESHIQKHGEHYKTCTDCNQIKPREDYYLSKKGVRAECKACFVERVRQYDQSPAGREKQRRYRDRHKNSAERKAKVAAQNRIQKLVQRGRIPPANELRCVSCGEQAANYHHHKGYSDAHKEDVVPLCLTCHRAEHAPEPCQI